MNPSDISGIYHSVNPQKIARTLPNKHHIPSYPIDISCVIYPRIGYTGCTGHYNIETFMNVYSTLEQTILQNQPIVFDENTCIQGQCLHVPNTSELWIWKPGFYQVYMSIYQLDSGQFSLMKNGSILIYGSTIGSIHGSLLNNMCIFEITENDISIPFMNKKSCKIELVNTSSLNSVSLYGSASSGNNLLQNTATISIVQIK